MRVKVALTMEPFTIGRESYRCISGMATSPSRPIPRQYLSS
jgi:hypothetical protein